MDAVEAETPPESSEPSTESPTPREPAMDAPEVEPPHKPHTGHRWIDLAFGVAALVVSLVSLMTAIHHGKVMEELVATNARQASAAVWPYLQFETSVERGDGENAVKVTLRNNGVGPAKIETFEVSVKGKSVKTWSELLAACCDAPADASAGISTSAVPGRVLPANGAVEVFELRASSTSKDLFGALIAASPTLSAKACYCSVFDQCWVAELRGQAAEKPERAPVASCPTPAVPFSR